MRLERSGFSQITIVVFLFLALVLFSVIGYWVRQRFWVDTQTLTNQKTTRETTKIILPEATIPDSFPKDFPIYPETRVTSALTDVQLGSGMDAWLSLETESSASSVLAFYTKATKESGWLSSSTQKTPRGTILRIAKEGKVATVSIEISKETKKTNILIIIGSVKLTS